MPESTKILLVIFLLALCYGLLLAFDFLPEIITNSYGFAGPAFAAGWLGAHAKDNDLENEISFRYVLMLLIFPIALGYYFYTNFSFKQASIKFLKSWLVIFLLVATTELPNIVINGLQTTQL